MNTTWYKIAYLIVAFYLLISCSKKQEATSSTVSQQASPVTFNPELYFKSYGIEDGLISTDLSNVYNDRKGYTWIATGKGAVRFDGIDFKNYFSDIEKGIYLDGATYFYEDMEGVFWALSGNGYLSFYDPVLDIFVPKKTKLENGWSTENPIRIYEEARGNFWLGGYGGLQYLDKKKDSVTLYPVSKIRSMAWPQAEKVRFEVIQKDREGNLWAGTRKFGLVKFNLTDETYNFIRDKPGYVGVKLDDWITDIIPADSGNLWIADYNVGLILFDPVNEEILKTFSFGKYADNRPNIYIRDILKDGERLILSTERSGLIIYDLATDQVIRQYNNNTEPALSSNIVKRTVMDNKGNLWMVGSNLQIGSATFYDFETLPFPQVVSNKNVYSLATSKQGDLLISTPKHTIFYNYAKDRTSAYSYLSKESTRNYGVCITADGRKFTSDEHQIIQINPQNNNVLKRYDANLPVDTTNNTLRRAAKFLEDSEGTLWTLDHWGRLKYIKETEIGNMPALIQDPETEKFINVICFIDDPSESHIIVGTDLGLATVSYGTHSVKWLALKSDNVPLSKAMFSYLYRDTKGQLWSLIEGQLYQLNLQELTAEPFTEIPSLESVKWIVEEPTGTYWLSTNKGVIRFNEETQYVTNFENNNFSEGSPSRPSPVVVSKDKIYFGGEAGLTIIDPSKLLINPNSPDVYLTRFTYPFEDNDKKIRDTTINLTGQKTIELDYFQNDLIFSYNGIEYKNPKRNTYAFFLEGYDTDWINVGTQRDAIYTNISPGTYTLKVNAANSDGVWTAQPTQLTVIINPPWWQTWWAYLTYALLFIAAIYGWIKYQVYQKTLKYKINEGLRTRISSDLHDEVGTILSGLAMKSELMSYTAPEKDREELNSISNMSKDAMERMRDTVWAIDSRKDNYENLFDKMKEYAQGNLSLKNIGFQFNAKGLNEESFISPEKRQNTYLIFKEAIANILKHSDAKVVNINAQMAEKMFKLIIADNGSPKEGYKSSGQGTSNMKMRAEKMGGQLDYVYDQGFIVQLKFPLDN